MAIKFTQAACSLEGVGGWACGKAAKEERTLNSGGVLPKIKQSTKRHLYVRALPALSGAAASLGSTRASMPASAHHRWEKSAWPSLGGRANGPGGPSRPASQTKRFSNQKVRKKWAQHSAVDIIAGVFPIPESTIPGFGKMENRYH
jgi:hypothetical protein